MQCGWWAVPSLHPSSIRPVLSSVLNLEHSTVGTLFLRGECLSVAIGRGRAGTTQNSKFAASLFRPPFQREESFYVCLWNDTIPI